MQTSQDALRIGYRISIYFVSVEAQVPALEMRRIDSESDKRLIRTETAGKAKLVK